MPETATLEHSENDPVREEDFAAKVERGVESIAELVARFFRTFFFILMRSARTGILLDPQTRKDFLPPLAFLVSGYFLSTASILFAAEFLVGGNGQNEPLARWMQQAAGQVEDADVSLLRLVAFALPVVAVVLGGSLLFAWLARLQRSLVTAVVAYTTTFIWTFYCFAALLLALCFAFISAADWLPEWAILLFFAILATIPLVVLLPPIVAVVLLRNAGAVAEAGRTRLRRRGTTFLLVLCSAGIWVFEGWLIAATLGHRLSGPPKLSLRTTVEGISAELPDTLAATLLVMSDTTWGFPDVSGDTVAGTIPMELVAFVRNDTDSTVVFPRVESLTVSERNELEIGKLTLAKTPEGTRADSLTPYQRVSIGVLDWQDGDAPLLQLKPGEQKWIRVQGRLRGGSLEYLLSDSYLRLHLSDREGNNIATSAWYMVDLKRRPR